MVEAIVASPAPVISDASGQPAVSNQSPAPVQNAPVVNGSVQTPVPAPAPAPEDWKAKYEQAEATRRQYQADRDRAEAALKETYKKMLPYIPSQEIGNVIGSTPANPQDMVTGLAERAAKGDVQAQIALDNYRAQAMEQRIMGGIQEEQRIREAVLNVENDIKRTYPSIMGADGKFNENDPLILEARSIVEQRPEAFNLSNPYQLQAVLENAQARLLLKKFPDLEKQLRSEIIAQQAHVGANIVSTPQSPAGLASNDMDGISPEQVETWKKEGYKTPEDLNRIAKIWKQANKEGGFVIQ